MLIYHITPHTDWESAQQKGEYRAESLAIEGFIHCSTEEQAAPVANAFYPAQKGLLLLVIDSARLKSKLQYDPPAHPTPESAPASLHGEFPHIYGALNLDAVIETCEFEPDGNDIFHFPQN